MREDDFWERKIPAPQVPIQNKEERKIENLERRKFFENLKKREMKFEILGKEGKKLDFFRKK